MALNGSQHPSAEKAKQKHAHEITLPRREGWVSSHEAETSLGKARREGRVRPLMESTRSTGGGDRGLKDAVAGAGGPCLLLSEASPSDGNKPSRCLCSCLREAHWKREVVRLLTPHLHPCTSESPSKCFKIRAPRPCTGPSRSGHHAGH